MPRGVSAVKTLRLETRDHGVKQIILSRPEVRNAFDETMIADLKEVLRELAAVSDPEQVRLLVLSGEGPVFSAGADVNYMMRLAASEESESLVDARALAQLFYALAAFPTPVVCAVRGAALGGGLGLAVCADFVLAEESATFATTEVRLGIVPGVISPYVVRKIGGGSAAPLLLSGRRVKAPEAKALGLVHQVVSPDGLDAGLDDVILEFLHAGPEAARRTKQLLLRAAPLPTPEHIELTARAIATARCSAEGQTGLASFFNKKTPPWVP
jgi:methylglutaconyl-CoA hydratase